MKKLNKILLITSLLSCLALNITSADKSDCWIFWSLPYHHEWSTSNGFDIVKQSRETTTWFANFLTIDQQKSIITNNDLNTAILNLKRYCCDNGKWWLKKTDKTCKDDEIFFNDNSLNSPYLFDHLFDVIMRRLNWLGGEKEIYTKTKMTLDDKWEERRNWINEKAEDKKWSTPQTIYAEYYKMWNQSPASKWYDIKTLIYPQFWKGNREFLNYIVWKWNSPESTTIANALQKYDDRTLYDRYSNACALAEYFYDLLEIGQDSSDKKTVISELAKGNNWLEGNNSMACDDIIKRQKAWENNYVQLIIKRSSNRFLTNYMEWYLSYMYDRQQTLQKLRKDSSDRFWDIVRAVPCLQKKCTH